MAKRGAISKLNLTLPTFSALTEAQAELQAAIKRSPLVTAVGFPGTGKTFSALHLGLLAVDAGEVDRVLIVRSVVPTREMGFLPGSMQEKTDPYKAPYREIVNKLTSCGSAFATLEKHGLIDFVSTSFEQGKTYERSYVIVDECQNLSFRELDLTITRLGEDCRIVYCGDRHQCYIETCSGYEHFAYILSGMESYVAVSFALSDIVRSGLVKEYILARELPDAYLVRT